MLSTTDMSKVARLTREGRLEEAMALLRGGVPGNVASVEPGGACSPPHDPALAARAFKKASGSFGSAFAGTPTFDGSKAPRFRGTPRATPNATVAAGASFAEHVFSCNAGTRAYKLYVPGAATGTALPLVVMMHGCTQSPDDFAAGTRMNEIAEEQGFLVAYPAQTRSANASRCWNWFSANDQMRDQGEPALIAGITRQISTAHGVDASRIFIAGLSAGGASAAVMGQRYPDLFAAVGVHSGLACGAARDIGSAFAAMRGGSPVRAGPRLVPTIVFHGDRDTTVAPVNGEEVLVQAGARAALATTVEEGVSPHGVAYTRTVHRGSDGREKLESWRIHGAGHAWSGGSANGTYTFPDGPDASRQMMRFFRSVTD